VSATSPGFCGIFLPAFSPRTRRRDERLAARGRALRLRLRDLLVPRILDGCASRRWRNAGELVRVLDTVLALSATVGEHEGVPLAPAWECTHPLALRYYARRAPDVDALERRHNRADEDERDRYRSQDRRWRRGVQRLAELGIITYEPGRGLAAHERRAAPIPSVYGLPALVELLGARGRRWIARALLDRTLLPTAHWARRTALWRMLFGDAPPDSIEERRRRLRAVVDDAPPPRADPLALAAVDAAPTPRAAARALEVATAEDPPHAGWQLVHAALEAPRQPLPELVTELPGVSSCGGPVVPLWAHSTSLPFPDLLRSVGTRQESPAPTEHASSPSTLRAWVERLRGRGSASTGSSSARSARSGFRGGTVDDDDTASVGRVAWRPGCGIARRHATEPPLCPRCEDTGQLARVAHTIDPAPCPDCARRHDAGANTLVAAGVEPAHTQARPARRKGDPDD
jgi:hypothetical protein